MCVLYYVQIEPDGQIILLFIICTAFALLLVPFSLSVYYSLNRSAVDFFCAFPYTQTCLHLPVTCNGRGKVNVGHRYTRQHYFYGHTEQFGLIKETISKLRSLSFLVSANTRMRNQTAWYESLVLICYKIFWVTHCKKLAI